jgi:hypothetical protein
MIIRDLLIRLGVVVDGKEEVRTIDDSLNTLKKSALGLLGALLSIKTAKWLVSTISRSEQLNARLQTVVGSAEEAARIMGEITEFSLSTPFQKGEIVEAFTALKASGFDATMDDMKAYGNIAAATGQNITYVAQALSNATVGSTAMIRRGLKLQAKLQNGKIIFIDEKGNERAFEKSAQGVQEYMREIGTTKFAGGMERQSATIAGAFSNLQDNLSNFAVQIGKSGLAKQINLLIREFTKIIKAGSSTSEVIGKTLGMGVRFLYKGLVLINKIMPLIAASSYAVGTALGTWGLSVLIKQLTLLIIQLFTTRMELYAIAKQKFIAAFAGIKGIIAQITALRTATMTTTLPWIVLTAAIILTVLAVQDFYTLLTGGESVIGKAFSKFGDVDEQIDMAKKALYSLLAVVVGAAALFLGWPIALGVAIVGLILIIYDRWGEISEFMVSTFNEVIDGIEYLFDSFLEWLGGWASSVGKGISGAISGAFDFISKKIEWLKSKFSELKDFAKNSVSNIGGGFLNFVGLGDDEPKTVGAAAGAGSSFLPIGASNPNLDTQARMSTIANNRSEVSAPINITINTDSSNPDDIARAVGSTTLESVNQATGRAASDFSGGQR